MRNTRPSLTDLAIKHHPLTGALIRPLWVRPDGRICWPMMGGAPDDGTGGDGGQGGAGGTGAGGAGAGAGGSGAGGSGDGAGGPKGGKGGAGDGGDLGFPRDTPLAEMTEKQVAAYWRHYARTHEDRFKDLVGDRTPEQIKADMAELAEIRKQQQTPAERQLTEQFDKGKAEGVRSGRTEAATAIFRGALEAGGIEGQDLDDMVAGFNVAAFVNDDGIDTAKITNFAKRFAPGTGTEGSGRERQWGAGRRQSGEPARGSGGKAEAERRFGKKTTTDA